MIDLDRRARRAGSLGVLLTTLGSLAGGSPSFAEEPQDMKSRVLQMFGWGDKKSDDSASPAAHAASPAPAQTAPSAQIAPGPAQIEPGPAASPTPAKAAPPTPAAGFTPSFDEKPSGEKNGLKFLLDSGLSGFTGKKDAAASDPKGKGLVDCPDIVVDGGHAELRAPPEAAASDVRYQLSITRMARECALNGDALAVRVGLQGAAMLGPAGQSGAYSGNVRVALRRKSDEKVLDEKTQHVGATIPPGASRGDFTLLIEDLSAPYISAKAADDYEVVVGFVGDSSSPGARAKRRRGG